MFMESIRPPVVLTVTGTDSSGGAGIQADLKTFTSLQCYGASVTTALVAQNTTGVQQVHIPPSAFVGRQMQSVFDDLEIEALKIGMLFNEAVAMTVVSTLKSFYPDRLPPLVVDPVCFSTSGHTLLDPGGVTVLREHLIPMATIITPSQSEAELLLAGDTKISSFTDMLLAAKALSSFGSKAVLLKGGHIVTYASEVVNASRAGCNIEWAEDGMGTTHSILILEAAGHASQNSQGKTPPLAVDILYQASFPDKYTLFVHPQVGSNNMHGTSCTLSAALACGLACGKTVLEATRAASRYTHQGIVTAFPLGKGSGALNHFHSLLERSLPLPNISSPYPFTSAMIKMSYDTWDQYVKHPFVRSLGEGTLPKENFVHFIKQDYHYLRYYGRAQSLVAVKSTSFDTMRYSAGVMTAVAREAVSHIERCKSYDISFEELVGTAESPATTAYGAYLIDIAYDKGDETLLLVAMAACLLGYGEVGLWLQSEARREESDIFLEGNPYRLWIEEYAGPTYQEAVRKGIDAIESHIAKCPPSPGQFEELRTVWERCTRLEIGFWDMALGLQ